ncbi:asparagine synthase C-terminal domain-containing protein [Sphingopyxis panaciterrulae]|uniref:asparagine synthase (glutamine-hydrolyzing) n=1 Tax=Sphingopyxis panaciterrulae TaxID=462372 RepID=A0A7W9B6X1_9SPHN|nr:asparagine synthase C-terminal domain-containing protein [Sphingopyxis panaciterrulae]MBB5707365.1 asparagine synthase (glutamine-hydrolyzing) [Sphingopyxis panaciterrulae]
MRRGVLAFLGAPEQATKVALAAERCGLTAVAVEPDLIIWAGEALDARRLPGGALVLGDIFSRSGATVQEPSDGWGSFIAIARWGDTVSVERAALTGMPIYWTPHSGGILCASHLDLIADLLPGQAIDWDFIGQALVYSNLRTDRTGLGSIRELLGGCRLAFDGRRAEVECLWSPWPHVAARNDEGVSELACMLERRIDACIRAWSQGRDGIVLELSGGLDSSIVAASLAGTGAGFSAINFVTPGADGDERHFACAVAARCGTELVEAMNDEGRIDLLAPPVHLHPRPAAYGVLGGIDAAFADAVAGGDRPIIGGIGGDNVFGFDSSIGPAVDAFAEFGFSRRTIHALRDVARAGGATIWEAARLLYRAQRAGPRQAWPRETSFCDAVAMPTMPFEHPWDAGAAEASRAKRKHVEAIRRILDFADRPDRWYGRDVIAPLLSQPVVELCLSIPSWSWFAGGRDRAIARAAFAKRLPAEVVWRRDKGRLESLCTAAFLRQRAGLRELLLGGRLAERGLLNRAAIAAYIDAADVVDNFDYFRLLEIADVERWVRAVETSSFFGPSSDQRRC